MNKTPSIWYLKDLLRMANECHVEINGKWVPARGEGFRSWRYRWHCAWLVFTGKADALIWPEGQ